MKTYRKVLLIVILLLLAAAAARFWYSRQGSSPAQKTDQQAHITEVVKQMQTLEFKKTDIPNDQKKLITDGFASEVKKLISAAKLLDTNRDAAYANLFWPLNDIGAFNRQTGDYGKAELAFQTAHELVPSAYVPLGNLGDLYSDAASPLLNDTKAAESYEQALAAIGADQKGADAGIYDTYLETYYNDLYVIYRFRFNDPAKAEKFLIDGVKKFPKVLNILAYLALYYRDTNQIDKAISRYHELLVKDPKSIAAQEALQQLEAK